MKIGKVQGAAANWPQAADQGATNSLPRGSILLTGNWDIVAVRRYQFPHDWYDEGGGMAVPAAARQMVARGSTVRCGGERSSAQINRRCSIAARSSSSRVSWPKRSQNSG